MIQHIRQHPYTMAYQHPSFMEWRQGIIPLTAKDGPVWYHNGIKEGL